MTNKNNNFRVNKFSNGTFQAFANFNSPREAVEYMRNWNPNQMHNWHIIDTYTGKRFQMNHDGTSLVVTYSGLGVLATN